VTGQLDPATTSLARIDRAPIDELVARFATEQRCPTVSWGVVHDGSLLVSGSHGSLGGRAVTARTVYRIASMTKSFSAAATLWLRDAGVLRLDDAIGRYAPELSGLRSGTRDAPDVTVRDLLAMTSGLATDDAWADRHLDLTDEEFDSIVAAGPVFAVPTGIEFHYSNLGFAVLGRVVRRASGRRIQDVISQELLGPLGMHDTTWVIPDHDDWAPPMAVVDGEWVDELPPLDDGLIAPMGGIWTTVADLARWVAWLDDGFPARDGDDPGPLRRASRREMQTIQRYVGTRTLREVTSPTGYGYGLRILDEPILGRVVTHSGGLPGYGSNMRWLQGRGCGVIALANSTYAPMTELTARILDLVHDQGFGAATEIAVPDELQTIAERLVALLNSVDPWDAASADRVLADNVAHDLSLERRRAQVATIVDASGHLTIERFEHVNHADTTVHLVAANGDHLTLTFTVAPVRPLRVQEYDLCRRT
jgi:CubicO group peptidase (beta-lactamase class C family)